MGPRAISNYRYSASGTAGTKAKIRDFKGAA
jgi:hypothetical protein